MNVARIASTASTRPVRVDAYAASELDGAAAVHLGLCLNAEATTVDRRRVLTPDQARELGEALVLASSLARLGPDQTVEIVAAIDPDEETRT